MGMSITVGTLLRTKAMAAVVVAGTPRRSSRVAGVEAMAADTEVALATRRGGKENQIIVSKISR